MINTLIHSYKLDLSFDQYYAPKCNVQHSYEECKLLNTNALITHNVTF